MDKYQVRAMFAAAELAAEAAVTTQFRHYDEFNPQHGTIEFSPTFSRHVVPM
jgi:hypothetical protein